jgi:hypothetical protein
VTGQNANTPNAAMHSEMKNSFPMPPSRMSDAHIPVEKTMTNYKQ